MVTAYVEVSRLNGFVLLVYNDGSNKPIFGIRIDPEELDEAIEESIRYRIGMDAVVNVQELSEVEDDLKKDVNADASISLAPTEDDNEEFNPEALEEILDQYYGPSDSNEDDEV